MLIEDINTAGPSGSLITTRTKSMRISASGTWNGGSVLLEVKLPDDSWAPVQTWTDDAYDIVDVIGSGTFRTNTTHGGSAPDLVFDVAVEWPSSIVAAE